ncbi:uncharacterized protein C1orf127 homolog isoform X2 [Electrophorus electricus]|nr:uncharacterized protein C1orf127 homolog isoform X2 [Electrophorus electricus]
MMLQFINAASSATSITDLAIMVSGLCGFFLFSLYLFLPICGDVLPVQKRDWIDSPPESTMEGDVGCFSEYMELWIHRMRIEGLRLWLSAMLRIQVALASLDSLNHQLSACGFGLHKDPDRNYIFRVMYSGCFVQLEHGHYVMPLNLLKRISRFGGRMRSYVMKCPVLAAPLSSEHIQCDPDFIQVTRLIPVDSWNNELSWSLALGGSLVVALEDASLIQVYVDIHKPYITVQGRRNTILSPVQVLQTEGQFLPLKLVSGNYAYSMEATCPTVTMYSSENTVLHIYKRRMGLTKRGGYDSETLSVSSVSVNQTSAFTWSENSGFVKLIIPTALIQKMKKCTEKEGRDLQQAFLRIDVVLTFKETNNKMVWTMENMSPCLEERMTSVTAPPYAEGTGRPLLSAEASGKNPQLLSQTTEGFSKTFKLAQVFPPTEGLRVASVSPWSTSSLETDTLRALNSINSLLANGGKSNVQAAEVMSTRSWEWTASRPGGLSRFVPTTPSYVTHEANLDSDDASSLGLHGSSLSTGETSSAITTEPSNLTADISTATDGSISKAARSGVAPPHHGEVNTMVKWTPVTSPLPLESTSLSLLDLKEVIIPKTVSDVPLNTRSASQKLLQLHRGHTQLSLTPPSPDIVMHSTGTNQTEPIHTPDEQVAGKYAPPR